MKKFFLVPVLAVLFASCSVDNETELFDEDEVVVTTANHTAHRMIETDAVACISYVYGTTIIDVSGGFTNPMVVFKADVPNTRTSAIGTKYTVRLEIETLADCEDLNSGTGIVTNYSLYNVAIPAVNDPSITLSPSQLPASCYRWRYVIEGFKTTSTGTTECINTTPWYEEPLF